MNSLREVIFFKYRFSQTFQNSSYIHMNVFLFVLLIWIIFLETVEKKKEHLASGKYLIKLELKKKKKNHLASGKYLMQTFNKH